MITVILRTCSSSLLESSDRERVCGNNRALMLRRCFRSTVAACKVADYYKPRLIVLDDNSDSFFLDFMRDEIESYGINGSIISLTERGPNHSAYMQFKLASEQEGIVYCVEDDYLHEQDAIVNMISAYNHLSANTGGGEVAIFPFDCIRNYIEGDCWTRLLHDGRRYWRTAHRSTNTILAHSSIFSKYSNEFFKLAKEYPSVMEDDTINTLYRSAENTTAPIQLYSPIPSIAYHLGYSDISQITTEASNWQTLWNKYQDWELIQGWFYDPRFYQEVVARLPVNATVVEIGAWRGRSTCCLASIIKQSSKNITLYSVDTWKGSDEGAHRDIIASMRSSLYGDFINNTKICGVHDVVVSLKKSSLEAVGMFDDNSIDFVMIDGSHDYGSVKDDILGWLAKVRTGGIIAGDDYHETWPGVVDAVNEIFGKDNVQVFNTTWYVYK